MEFDELQKIWDAEAGDLFVINEEALHRQIAEKKRIIRRKINFTELSLIGVNLGVGIFLTVLSFLSVKFLFFLTAGAVWTLITAAIIFIRRTQRIKTKNQFDRTMLGDLKQSLEDATWQVRQSQFMRWSALMLTVLCLVGLWQVRPIGVVIIAAVGFAFGNFAAWWEHQLYKSRKQELEVLLKKLKNG